MQLSAFLLAAACAYRALGCEADCGGSGRAAPAVRRVRRMQPDAEPAAAGPRGALEWGQINFVHTTDTHGWLEGHVKERNYGADWGDFASFVAHQRAAAARRGVDLLVVDTGDLHDGAGLSDATTPNGAVSNAVFASGGIDFDLLAIGNHELYLANVAYETWANFAALYGDRYLTSNVQILSPESGQWEPIGARYRYFTTAHGLRIMAFGVLFDFSGNTNVTKVTHPAELVQEPWFLAAVNFSEPIDLFVVIGHNPVNSSRGLAKGTFDTIIGAIRRVHPDTPIQGFGGHTHMRDFAVFDSQATALESGRYCETVGWLALSGISSATCNATYYPAGVSNPTRPSLRKTPVANATAAAVPLTSDTPSSLRYARRYLDWNRLTFAWHAVGIQDGTFDTAPGEAVSANITSYRKALDLTTLYGCAPRTYCQHCRPFGDPGNLLSLVEAALAATVINESRKDVPRLIVVNSGSLRFDLVKGPFTYDDAFMVSPFKDGFQYLPDVSYDQAQQVIGILNTGPPQKKHSFGQMLSAPSLLLVRDQCIDPPFSPHQSLLSSPSLPREARFQSDSRSRRRQVTDVPLTPGYTTVDDFGVDGDDTVHSTIPAYSMLNDVAANASFPTDGSLPATVDLVFLDFLAEDVLVALQSLKSTVQESDVADYVDQIFTINSYLPAYAKMAWQANMPRCPMGTGVDDAD